MIPVKQRMGGFNTLFLKCRPVSLNGGMPMPAWFDLAQLDQLLKGEQDGAGVAASIAHIGNPWTPRSFNGEGGDMPFNSVA